MQAKKKTISAFRSTCPVSSLLDMLGDKWSLLIIRDMCLFGKRTFGEFAGSPEHVATNILTDRLKRLEENGFITKSRTEENKKTFLYSLTEKGTDLLPILAEYILWGEKYLEIPIHSSAKQFAKQLKADRKGTLTKARKRLLEN